MEPMELDRFEWLAQRVETAIDPGQRIIDPHHHLWDRGGSTYLAPQLLADLAAEHRVVKTVFVECRAGYDRTAASHLAPVGETEFVAAEAKITDAESGPTIAAIVPFADMMLGDAVEEVVTAHVEAAGGRFRGIRHATSWDASDEIENGHTRPSESMMLTPEFRAGVRRLATMGYSFDAWLYHPQLTELSELAAAVPEALIVVNHLGGPLRIGPYGRTQHEAHAHWRASMEGLARQPNVVLKVGGIGLCTYFGMDWPRRPVPPGSEEVAAYWSDDVRWCIDRFGPDRCMFESNYPVDRQALTYPVLWNAFQIIAATYDAAERDRLFAGTAEEIYRLG